MNTVEFIEMLGRPEPDAVQPLPLPEVQVLTLREVYARYAEGCTFKPGDIVTPREGYAVKGAGVPHIVLSVGLYPAPPIWPADPTSASSSTFGKRLDMRVAALNAESGRMFANWVESWEFEAWVGEGVNG